MIAPQEFDLLVSQVAKLNGLDLETAEGAVAEAGDCRMIDDGGKIAVVLPDGRELRLQWPDEDPET